MKPKANIIPKMASLCAGHRLPKPDRNGSPRSTPELWGFG